MPKQSTNTSAKKVTKAATVKKTVAKKVAAKKTVAKKAAVKKTAVKKVAAKKTVAKKAAAKKAVARKEPVVTTIIAKFDAGFGNQLYLRGNCSGLTWDSGTLMDNTGSDEWIWKSTVVTSELEFKVLINDSVWSVGPNGVVFPGATVVFEPSF
mgnify:CR=1 FL=1